MIAVPDHDPGPSAGIASQAIAALQQGVVVVDKQGTVLLKNGALERLLDEKLLHDILGGRLVAGGQTTSELNAGGRTFCVRAVPLPDGLMLVVEDISDRMVERQRALAQARADPLTNLGNRLYFREFLSRAIREKATADCPVAVLVIDLDRFKSVNDSLGHPTGDAVLQLVSDRLASVLRDGKIAARLGGDEFGIVQTGQAQPEAARKLAERLVDLLGRACIVDGQVLNIGASIGITLVTSGDARIDDVLREADVALYNAKEEGRGRYRFFQPSMAEEIEVRRGLEVDLRRALALKELRLVFQPQLELSSGEINGFEALLRWHHPERGVVSPATFIGLAEDMGLIVPIGEWVIRNACRAAVAWPDHVRVAINVSAAQVADPGLLPALSSALRESGLDPGRLEIEITESVLLHDHQGVVDTLHRIRSAGISIAMDDFGTGYSSLSYLRSFPFHTIKIDQSFIRSVNFQQSNSQIVRAIAALARALGMSTTAEGIETVEQLIQVTADGCSNVQGYLISPPMEEDRIGEFLARFRPLALSAA